MRRPRLYVTWAGHAGIASLRKSGLGAPPKTPLVFRSGQTEPGIFVPGRISFWLYQSASFPQIERLVHQTRGSFAALAINNDDILIWKFRQHFCSPDSSCALSERLT